MKKNIKKITLLVLILGLFACMCCCVTKTHARVYAEETTDLNEETATVKVVLNGDVSYHESFSDAVGGALKNSTLILLQDANFCEIYNKTLIIDLNGKTLTNSNGAKANYANLTIMDSVGSGKISGGFSCYSSIITVQSGCVEKITITSNSTGIIAGGKIGTVYSISKSLNVSGGEIDLLYIYDSSISLSACTINKFIFTNGVAENYKMLADGYAFANKENNSPIKIADMTTSTPVNIIKCAHGAFTSSTSSVCDYCGYVCSHSGYYNKDGVCGLCGNVCLHEEIDDSNVCLECNLPIEAKVRNTTNTKNYIKFKDAVASIVDGDTLILCRDIKVDESTYINDSCTIDLNGCAVSGYYIDLKNKIVVIDSVGNGSLCVASSSVSSNIELRGAESTRFIVMLNGDRLKFYSGRLEMVNVYNGSIDNLLPTGYIFVKHENSAERKLTKEESATSSFYLKGSYLTVEECLHDAVDNNLNCKYCGSTLTDEQILKALAKDLQTTKEELSQALEKKEDIETINEKVKTLNETITRIESVCKLYSDNADNNLKLQLESLINTAKDDAIESSSTALELAKNELLNIIGKKLDIETYNMKVKDLADAISNAELLSKAYADSNDSALKIELLSKIAGSKVALQNVNDQMLERLLKAEIELETNANDISNLKTALIVLSFLFVSVMAVGFILLYLNISKLSNKNSKEK